MEQDFTIEDIIAIMKKTKKTDPLFKPLKKLKTALEVALLLLRVSASGTCPFKQQKES